MANNAQHATIGHPLHHNRHSGHRAFDAAIRQLVPSANRKDTLALFHNQISFSGLRHWRKGRRSIPQWAKDLVAEALAHGARRYEQSLAELQAAPRVSHLGYAPNILAWNARQKEKAGDKPAS